MTITVNYSRSHKYKLIRNTNLELIDPNLVMKSENSRNNNHVMVNYLNQLLMHPPSLEVACNEYLKIFIYSRPFSA